MSNGNASISVIVICRNARPFIESCINSIRAQTYPSNEIIVVDGHSTDGTLEWLNEQTDLHIMPQFNQGIANARNLGISKAQGELIAFLDADDVWPVDKLALQLEILQKMPQCEAVTGQLINSGDNHTYLAMTPGGFLFRRSVFERYGLFDARWQIASEHEWLLRSKRLGMFKHVLPTVVLHKNMHGNNLSLTHKKLYRNEVMAVMREHHEKNILARQKTDDCMLTLYPACRSDLAG